MNSSTPSSSSGLVRAIAAMTCVEFFETGLVVFTASQIMAGLNLSPADFALSFTLYGVASIFMLYKHRWMVERFGYRRFIGASLLVFATGAVVCATAHGLIQFAIGRALQGAAGATFFTAGRLHINELPEKARFRGLMAFVGSLLGATSLAPVAAALLLGIGGWPAIFWCIPLLLLAVGRLTLPHASTQTTPVAERSEEHWGWLVWLVIGIFGLQYSIEALPSLAALPDFGILATGLASTLMLSLFAWRQWRKEKPLIDYRGLLQRRYLLGITLYFAGYFMAGASGFVLPLLFQQALGLSLPATAGIISLGLAGSVVSALLHAAMMRRWPRSRLFMLLGLTLYAMSCLIFSRVDQADHWSWLLLSALLGGIAIPLFLGTTAFGTFSELSPKVFSHGYQVKNIVRQLGLSSSIALNTLGLQFFYQRELASHAELTTLPRWETVLHSLSATNGSSNSMLTACSELFVLLALLTIPVAMLVTIQRTFR